MDLHAGQIQGFFQKPLDHMTARFMPTQHFFDLGLSRPRRRRPRRRPRQARTSSFASKIGAELAILDKERPAQQVAEIGYVIGDVKDKTAVIVDDMIDTAGDAQGGRLYSARRRRQSVYAAATHGVFSGRCVREPVLPRASRRSSSLTRSRAGGDIPQTSACSPCAESLTDLIRYIFTDDSVSQLFGGENQLS